ncbi:nose resistant to fluoxetine protein 6-like [Ptychodera flava]|uniref:nose resistant to fluoxetine protein 6-like n=1 Tax=Ptychodera flava TaxID=63121 RepID=UPI00396AA541
MIRADSSVNSDPEVNAHTEIRDHIGNEEENLIMKQHATKNPGVASKCLLTFSVLDSGRKILNTDAGRGSISCLNGIRVLSMFWIILLHSYLYLGSSPSYSENYRFITDVVYQRWTATVLWQGHLGVEGFLVLSGLLVSYLTLQQFDKCGGPGKHRWWLFYLHRYWRLTPVYAFCLMMYATLTLHMGNGVWWFSWYGAQGVCQNKWWANMLYINNLYPFPGTVSECMGWSWYLAVDMQLYIISPIFIITFYKSWRAGLGLSLGTILCSFGICAYLVTVQGMPAGLDQKPYRSPKYDPATGDWIYGKPYYRIPQYLVGVGLGYVLFILKGIQSESTRS